MVLRNLVLMAASGLWLAGCGTTTTDVPADAAIAGGDAAVASPDMAGGACAPVNPPCTDQQIQDLLLYKKASTRVVENTPETGGFVTHVDSSAGGLQPTESYVYVKLTDTGAMRVSVGDEAAFNSVDWDLAFRRYVARVNSGVGGPSCVGATEAGGAAYDTLDAAGAAGFSYSQEAYYDAQCKVITDATGIGAPVTLLSGFWTYSNCVQMTGKVYVIKLASGRRVKLTFTSYYPPADQATCDMTGNIPMGTAGGQLRFRWAFLDK